MSAVERRGKVRNIVAHRRTGMCELVRERSREAGRRSEWARQGRQRSKRAEESGVDGPGQTKNTLKSSASSP
jgi:hypothetical protein